MITIKHKIQEKYDRIAFAYDLFIGLIDISIRTPRLELFKGLHGRILDVAGGTGANLQYIPAHCQITAIDLSEKMLDVYQVKAKKEERTVKTLIMDAEELRFPDESFDGIVETNALCTLPNPVTALKEMNRVCRPGGDIILIDHGCSSISQLRFWQNRLANCWLRISYCHLNREPIELVKAADLTIRKNSRQLAGIFSMIHATKSN